MSEDAGSRTNARVLQLLGPSTGGIRRHVAFLAGELRIRGWTVETAGPARVLDDLGGVDHVVNVPAGLQLAAVPGAVASLRKLQTNYSIVHAHGLTAGWIAVLAEARRRQSRVVVTIHNVVLDEVAGRSARLLRMFEHGLMRRVDHAVAVSPQIADEVRRVAPRTPVSVVGPLGPPPRPQRGVATTRAALGAAVGTALVVCVARLHPQKGIDVLLAAMPAVIAAVPGARLAVVGEGPQRGELEDQARALGLEDRVVFAEPSNPADELAAADVVVIPSRWESGPLVLTEALLLGRPVVATPVGSVAELVTDGDTGWLVPVGDRPALAAAIVDALSDPIEAERRGEVGRRRAETVVDTDRRVSLVTDAYRASLDRR